MTFRVVYTVESDGNARMVSSSEKSCRTQRVILIEVFHESRRRVLIRSRKKRITTTLISYETRNVRFDIVARVERKYYLHKIYTSVENTRTIFITTTLCRNARCGRLIYEAGSLTTYRIARTRLQCRDD